MSRETRLLLVTIGVSVLLLVVLARFRFPQPPSAGASGPVVAPLDRILARDVLGEVASALRTLEPVVGRGVVALRARTVDRAGGRATEAPTIVPALRLRDDVAIALLSPEARVVEVIGAGADPPTILGSDVVRGLVAVRVPKQAAPTLSLSPPLDGDNAVLVALVQGSEAGASIRPIFTGQGGELRDPRWRSPLLALDSRAAPTGSFVFALDGQLAGLVIDTDSDAGLVPAVEFVEAGEALIAGNRPHAGDLGVKVQPLTDALVIATGAATGAVVGSVDPAGPAHDLLHPGDVIVALDDLPVRSSRGFERHVVALRPGVAVRVAIVRLGDRMTITFTARDRPEPPSEQIAPSMGARLRLVPRTGTRVVEIAPRSPADMAGLIASDVITRVGEVESPSPEEVEHAWTSSARGGALMLVVSRGGTPQVLAIRKP